MATSGFFIHRGERTDVLAEGLASLLADPLPDPFAEEIVVVSALGMERWLAQRLSHRLGVSAGAADGVCAGVRFARPRALVGELTRPVGSPPNWRDPWDPDQLLWPVAESIDAALADPSAAWIAQIAHHLGRGLDEQEQHQRAGRRLGLARDLARLFHSYAVQRPSLAAAWTAGDDHDGTGSALPDTVAWQPHLWRSLRQHLDAPSPDERLAAAADRARADARSFDLPDRLSLFGHNRLPLAELRLLAALSIHREVHLWLPHPSPAMWDSLTGQSGTIVARSEVRSPPDDDHRLLTTLGTELRELQRSLRTVVPDAQSDAIAAIERPETLLGHLQAGLVGGRAQVGSHAADASVQIHACHGPARQVEVLREVLIGLLEDDPTLEPRDMVILCPDIETYAPLFQAAFGLADPQGPVPSSIHPGQQLRVSLADRSAAVTNPLLGTVVTLLTLAARGRFTATDVVDLLDSVPVRTRFGLNDEHIERATGWVEATAVRWGLDTEHRARFAVAFGQNTWRAGIDRVLAGVAHDESPDAAVGDVLPLDDVTSNDIELAGRLGEFLDLLTKAADELDAGSRPASQWAEVLAEAVLGIAAVSGSDQWQLDRLHRELEALGSAGDTELRPDELLSLVRDRWSGRAGRAGFRTGALTVCTMVPMRTVPHRVVAMIGLDDGVFPRAGRSTGDDVLAVTPLTGEHDVRIEDRQLFLDAIGSATDHLVLTFTGADEQRGLPRPPAVPLGELIDHLSSVTGVSRAELVTGHPLQPFDDRNLRPGAIVPGAQPFSFDPAALDGATANRRRQPRRTTLLSAPLPAPEQASDLDLADLQRLFEHPAKAFLRQRLDVSIPPRSGKLDEAIPLELDGLRKWQIGDALLADTLAGVDPATAAEAARRRGTLPPGKLGLDLLSGIGQVVGPLAAHTAEWRAPERRTIDIDLPTSHGRRLTGSVDNVYGTRLVTVTYSSIGAKQLIRAWLPLLALTAQDPSTPWSAQLAGRYGSSVQLCELTAVGGDAAALLGEVVELYDAGLLHPLPLPPKLSKEFSENLTRDARLAFGKARRAWEDDNGRVPSERDTPEDRLVWGANAPFTVLREANFEHLAPRLWNPILEHLRESRR